MILPTVLQVWNYCHKFGLRHLHARTKFGVRGMPWLLQQSKTKTWISQHATLVAAAICFCIVYCAVALALLLF
jgi:hypothetical protein